MAQKTIRPTVPSPPNRGTEYRTLFSWEDHNSRLRPEIGKKSSDAVGTVPIGSDSITQIACHANVSLISVWRINPELGRTRDKVRSESRQVGNLPHGADLD